MTPGTRVELVSSALGPWPAGTVGTVLDGRVSDFPVAVGLDCDPDRRLGFHERELRVLEAPPP